MANIIRIKRGNNISDSVTLLAGELALDLATGILYAGNEAGKPTKIKGVAEKLEVAQLIKLTGDVTGEANFDGSTTAAITATLAEITEGKTINGITFNNKGLITGAEEVTYKVEDIDGLTEALDGKVDKEAGKSLVSDDEIARLAGVDNYDDSELRGLVDNKADKTELDGLATEAYVDEKIGDIDFATLATKTEVSAINERVTIAEGEIDALQAGLADVYTKTEIDDTLEGYATDEELKNVSDNLGAVDGRLTTAEGKITTVEETLANKADANNVYTKTEVDSTVAGLSTAIGAKADSATTLAGYGINDAYTKSEVDGMVAGTFHFRGEAASLEALPTDANEGDVYQVGDKEYAYNGEDWVELGFNIDLSVYATTAAMNAALESKLDKSEFNTTIANYATTEKMNEELAKKAEASALTTLEGKVTDNTEAIATKAAQADLDTVSGKVTTLEETVAEHTNEIGEKANSADVYAKSEVYTKEEVHSTVQDILDGTKVLTDDTIIDGGTF